MIDEFGNTLDSQLFSYDSSSNIYSLTKPIIGVMDSTVVASGLIKSLGSVAAYPALKFVLSFQKGSPIYDGEDSNSHKDAKDDTSDDNNDDEEIIMWDHVGPRETAKDLFDSVMMYWYRFVASHAMERRRVKTNLNTDDESVTEIHNNEHGEARPPVFIFETADEIFGFLKRHGELVLRPAQARLRHHSKSRLESEVFDLYMGGFHRDVGGIFYDYEPMQEDSDGQCNLSEGGGNFTQEIDPYIILVQCRLSLEEGNTSDEGQTQARSDFDEIAEEMAHRRDVAFFAIESSSSDCGSWFRDRRHDTNNSVAVLRARRYVSYSISPVDDNYVGEQDSPKIYWSQHQRRIVHNITTDWETLTKGPPRVFFTPSKVEPDIEADPNEFVKSNLVSTVVVHTTPTVMWFDRQRMSQLAFPSYRQVHAVLFVDIGRTHERHNSDTSSSPETDVGNQPAWPPSLIHSAETEDLLLEQQKAIQLFYNAALRHRNQNPTEDIVFLIIPSRETRIMSKFGIDIWTPLDEALFNASNASAPRNVTQESDASEHNAGSNVRRRILPVMVITDSSLHSGKQSARYYLRSDEVFAPSSMSPDQGAAIGAFLDSFLDGIIGKPFIRSETERSPENKYSMQGNQQLSNVTILTGNTFESLVMDRVDTHTMVFMQITTCGHCLRFSIFWNEFSSLVKALNWDSVIDIMKVDVSTNDIPHPKVSVWDLPAVYYFPAGDKNNPIEVTLDTPAGDDDDEEGDSDDEFQRLRERIRYDEGLTWVKSGYDLVEWMIKQDKLDLDILSGLDDNHKKILDGDVFIDLDGLEEEGEEGQ
jgi:hypothetical protein